MKKMFSDMEIWENIRIFKRIFLHAFLGEMLFSVVKALFLIFVFR